MANVYNHVFDTPDFRYLPVASSTVIEIGDLLYWDGSTVKPASMLSWGGDEAATQDAFARKFAGAALQASADGDDFAVKVGVAGIFELSCDSASFAVGDGVAPAKQSGSNALENGKVKSASGMAAGAVYRATSSQARVLVDIHPAAAAAGFIPEQMTVFRYDAGGAIGSSPVTAAAFEFPGDVLVTRAYLALDQAPGDAKTVTATITDGVNSKTVTVSGTSDTTGSDEDVDQSYDADASIEIKFEQTAAGSAQWATLVVFYRPQRG